MPCVQNQGLPGLASYATEEDCLDACAEGACCETDGTCNIKPQCECDTDNGAVFAGVGEGCEVCPPSLCAGVPDGSLISFTVSGADDYTLIRRGVIDDPCFEANRQWLEAYGVGAGDPVTLVSKFFGSDINGTYTFRKDSFSLFTLISSPSGLPAQPVLSRGFPAGYFFSTYATITAALDITAAGADPQKGDRGTVGSVYSFSTFGQMGVRICPDAATLTGCYQSSESENECSLFIAPSRTTPCGSFASYDAVEERNTFTARIDIDISLPENPLP